MGDSTYVQKTPFDRLYLNDAGIRITSFKYEANLY